MKVARSFCGRPRLGGLGILVLLLLVVCLPRAALSASTSIVHVGQVFSAYQGNASGNQRTWAGYAPTPPAAACYPGVLAIEPGGTQWPNYISAAQASTPYTITGVTLVKQTPATNQMCSNTYPAKTITQTGAANIRLNWPLLYEAPGSTWTLTINYDTPTLWDDDGKGPNKASLNHTETWVWYLESDPQSLRNLLSLLHNVAIGTSGVPAISNEALYSNLAVWFEAAQSAYEAGDIATAAMIVADAELALMDACITAAPASPDPTGRQTGVIASVENPAFCKLISDIEYIFLSGG